MSREDLEDIEQNTADLLFKINELMILEGELANNTNRLLYMAIFLSLISLTLSLWVLSTR